MKGTRERLLLAARDRLRSGGVGEVTMAAVARAAGVSRQAVYLHFRDRAELLVDLTDLLDRESDLDRYVAGMRDAPDGVTAVRRWAEMQRDRNPRIAPLARALDAARSEDPASAAAWRARLANRLAWARVLVARLADEGRVHPSWDRDQGALLLAELTGFRVWDDLVNEGGLPPDVYVRTVVSAALAALAAPVDEGQVAQGA